jgi:hypothetical protein
MDIVAEQPARISALREKLLEGLTPFKTFAAAMGRHPKTVKKMNPPIVRIGREDYVPDEEARAWILNGCRPLQNQGRSNRRRSGT